MPAPTADYSSLVHYFEVQYGMPRHEAELLAMGIVSEPPNPQTSKVVAEANHAATAKASPAHAEDAVWASMQRYSQQLDAYKDLSTVPLRKDLASGASQPKRGHVGP